MKKVTVVLLCIGVLLCMGITSFAAYSDMPSGLDGEVLQKAVDNGLISGFEDGTLRPDAPITRAQMAAIITRAFNAQDNADISEFSDVAKDAWYYDAMSKAVFMEAFKGDSEKKLNPDSNISRQEALIVLCRIFDLPPAKISALAPYPDAAQVASWAQKEVSSIAYGNYLDADKIRPLDAMTRLEFAKIMDKLVKTYIDNDGEYTSLPEGNVLVRAKNVSFKGVKTDNNVFISDGAKGTVELTDCIFNDVIIRGGTTVIYSGEYTRVRAIGKDTFAKLEASPISLVKKFEDGTTGKFYGKPGKGTIIVPATNIELLQ